MLPTVRLYTAKSRLYYLLYFTLLCFTTLFFCFPVCVKILEILSRDAVTAIVENSIVAMLSVLLIMLPKRNKGENITYYHFFGLQTNAI